MCGEKGKEKDRLTEKGGEAESLREDEEGEGEEGKLPAAKLQSPSCHLHYLTFHHSTNPIIILLSQCVVCPREFLRKIK